MSLCESLLCENVFDTFILPHFTERFLSFASKVGNCCSFKLLLYNSIQNSCDEVGCKVEFSGDDYGFTVRFYRHCGEGWGENVQRLSAINSAQVGTHDGTQQEIEYRGKLLGLIQKNNKITRQQMADALALSIRTVQRILNTMSQVHYTGSGRSGHWEITSSDH